MSAQQLRLPFTRQDLWAIVDPAGARPAPWWTAVATPTKRDVNEAWSRRMKLVETVTAHPDALSPTSVPVAPASVWPAACRDRLRQQLIALRTAPATRQARRDALRRMASWR